MKKLIRRFIPRGADILVRPMGKNSFVEGRRDDFWLMDHGFKPIDKVVIWTKEDDGITLTVSPIVVYKGRMR